MRSLVAKRWYLGPVLAVLGLIFCSVSRSTQRDVGIETWHAATIDKIYKLAARRNYAALRTANLLREESIRYLELQDKLFGPIEAWRSETIDEGGLVSFERAGFAGRDMVTHAKVDLPQYGYRSSGYYDYDSFSPFSNPANDVDRPLSIESSAVLDSLARDQSCSSKESSLDMARNFLHTRGTPDGCKIVGPLKAEKFGGSWIVTETTKRNGFYERWYLVAEEHDYWMVRYRDARRWLDAGTRDLDPSSNPVLDDNAEH